MSAIVQKFEHSLALPFFGIGMKTDLFQSCGHCWVFQICWHVECSTFTASSFRIWNNSTRIPSPPLALFVLILLRPTWLHIPGCLALGQWSHHRDYLGHEDLCPINEQICSFSLLKFSWLSLHDFTATFQLWASIISCFIVFISLCNWISVWLGFLDG